MCKVASAAKHQILKVYKGCGGEALHIHNLSTRWRLVAKYTLYLLYLQGKSPRYSMESGLAVEGEGKNHHACQESNPDQTTSKQSLYWLR
jgi:hypothetical protein